MSLSNPPIAMINTLPNGRTRGDKTAAWKALQQHFDKTGKDFDARDAFAADATRFETLSQQVPYVFADLSKNRLDVTTQSLLLDLAHQSGVEAHRAAMFAGEKVNNAENRAVMHWLLRQGEKNHKSAKNEHNSPVADVFIDSTAINNIADSVTNSVTNSEVKEDIDANLALVHQTLNPMLAYAE
jgi:glucose-6-phosphate isomerase